MDKITDKNMNTALEQGFSGVFQYVLIAHLRHRPEVTKVAVGKLSVEDFETPVCQVLWESLSDYYSKYKQLPSTEILMTDVVAIAKGNKPGAKTLILQEHFLALNSTFQYVEAFNHAEFNDQYMLDTLPEYILWVRGSRIYEEHRTSVTMNARGVDALESSLANLKKEVSSMTSVETLSDVTMADCRIQDDEELQHIPTGIRKLDRYLSGGLMRRTIGMVAACPGVGKTNTLINFGLAAGLNDYRALVITLEVENRKMMQRYVCMAAAIPGATMKTPVAQWPIDEACRYDLLRNPHYPSCKAVTFSGLADQARQIHLREIEDEIVKWKEKVIEEGGDEEDCALVCVDWVDLIAGLGKDKNEPDYKRVCTILEELRKIAVRHNVALWTATQAKAEAYNRAVVQMNDIAHGFAKSFPLDVSIGIGLDVPSQVAQSYNDEGEDDTSEEPDDDKHLVFTINKNRDGSNGIIKVYQAPDLRFFDSEENAMSYIDGLQNIGSDPIKAYSLAQAAGRQDQPSMNGFPT